jgi:mannose-6-phosphate isomerase-like protein (cupin superfamily)
MKLLVCVVLVGLVAGVASAQNAPAAGAQKETAKPATAAVKAEPINKGGALYFNKEQVEKTFAAGGSFVKEADKNYQISAGKRTTPGQAEVHGKDTDIFFVVDGTATIVTGGSLVDEKTTAPDEIRGTAIKGGETTQLSKGELIVIPRGTPHWIQQVQGTFEYLVVKVR